MLVYAYRVVIIARASSCCQFTGAWFSPMRPDQLLTDHRTPTAWKGWPLTRCCASRLCFRTGILDLRVRRRNVLSAHLVDGASDDGG